MRQYIQRKVSLYNLSEDKRMYSWGVKKILASQLPALHYLALHKAELAGKAASYYYYYQRSVSSDTALMLVLLLAWLGRGQLLIFCCYRDRCISEHLAGQSLLQHSTVSKC